MGKQFSGWAGCLLAVALGCSSPVEVPVEGTVTFDGQPVNQGAISFVAERPGARSEGAVISNGVFKGMITPGTKRVEIRASRPKKLDRTDPDSAGLREDFIPAQFNTASSLRAEIFADRENKLTFDLGSR